MGQIQHEDWMRLALTLAEKGKGRTSPNPMVGAVLVKNNKVLASGYHHRHGAAHAELDCLRKVNGKAPKNSILYVTLEPCCHHGFTPPCSDAILKSGVRRVLVATRDPNPQVMGKGIEKLRRAGIVVTVGVLEDEARTLNRFYFCWREKKRPYVILKAALTLDGKVGTVGHMTWITGAVARKEAHRLRNAVDAILVGIGTVLADNPSLTVRHVRPSGKAPIKIILDSAVRTPPRAKVLKGAPTAIVCSPAALQSKRAKTLEKKGAELLPVPFGQLLPALAERKILSLLVEGGPRVYASFLTAGLVDEVVLFVAPRLLGKKGLPFLSERTARVLEKRFRIRLMKKVGKDLCLTLVKR